MVIHTCTCVTKPSSFLVSCQDANSCLHCIFFLCNIRDEIKLNDYSILSSHLMAVIDPMMSKIYISVNAIVMLCKMYTVSKTYMV